MKTIITIGISLFVIMLITIPVSASRLELPDEINLDQKILTFNPRYVEITSPCEVVFLLMPTPEDPMNMVQVRGGFLTQYGDYACWSLEWYKPEVKDVCMFPEYGCNNS